MKYATIITLLLPALLAAQPFEFVQELDSIPVVVDGDTLPAPWLGGYGEVYPRTGDLDGDGDLDLLIGWWNGTIDYWQNIGTPFDSRYRLQQRVFLGIDFGFYAKLAIWDMDADGDLDLLVRGAYPIDYPMMVMENVGGPFNPNYEVFEDSLRDNEGNYIWGNGFDTADIDADGDEDLFVVNANGIMYYKNIGDSTQYSFFLMTSQFAGIITGFSSSVFFCDIDADSDLDLFIGTVDGKIMFYRNDGTPQVYDFTLVTNQWMNIDVGEKAIPEFGDIDADGDYDLLIGKDNDETWIVPGDLHYWRNDGTPQEPQMVLENKMYLTLDFEDGTEPGIMDVNSDDKGDLFVHAFYISWLKDVGTSQSPVYELQSYNAAGTGFLASSVDYGDLNGDTHDDMVVVYGWSGNVQFWFNNGDTLNPQFYYYSGFSIGQLAGGPVLADMDGDGDNDLIIGVTSMHFDDYIYYYENQGNPQQSDFVLTTTNYQGWAGQYDVGAAFDADGDGDNDIIALDTAYAEVYFENIGTPQNAVFAGPQIIFPAWGPSSIGAPGAFCDVDNDGDWDAFGGSISGGVLFYRNITGDSTGVAPRHQTLAPYRGPVLSIGPNPANPLTIISCQLPAASSLSLEIFDISGKKVVELASGFHLPGEYRYVWDASKNASGIYIIRLKTPEFDTSQKLTIVK